MLMVNENTKPDLKTINALITDIYDAQVVGCIPSLGQYLVEINNSGTDDEEKLTVLKDAIQQLRHQDFIVEGFPNAQLFDIFSRQTQCDDDECKWYMEKIIAPYAWPLASAGNTESSVAVIDYGVDCTHPELNCDEQRHFEDVIDHGTGVSSLINAQNNDGTDLLGLAHNAGLYPYNLGDSSVIKRI